MTDLLRTLADLRGITDKLEPNAVEQRVELLAGAIQSPRYEGRISGSRESHMPAFDTEGQAFLKMGAEYETAIVESLRQAEKARRIQQILFTAVTRPDSLPWCANVDVGCHNLVDGARECVRCRVHRHRYKSTWGHLGGCECNACAGDDKT